MWFIFIYLFNTISQLNGCFSWRGLNPAQCPLDVLRGWILRSRLILRVPLDAVLVREASLHRFTIGRPISQELVNYQGTAAVVWGKTQELRLLNLEAGLHVLNIWDADLQCLWCFWGILGFITRKCEMRFGKTLQRVNIFKSSFVHQMKVNIMLFT